MIAIDQDAENFKVQPLTIVLSIRIYLTDFIADWRLVLGSDTP
jgi:hypothetical protein